MLNFFLSKDAEEDLQDIYLFTEVKWNETQAKEYVNSVYKACALLGETPRMGRLRRELGDGIRSHMCASHVIFFMEWQGEVAIVRILHQSRDFEELFGSYNPQLQEKR